jgi:hypothetical protein
MYGQVPAGVVIPVRIIVSVKTTYDSLRQILATSIDLHRRNQEETAFKFRLTKEGDLVTGSVSTLRHRLITAPF